MATNDPKAVAAQQRDIANLLQRQLDVAEQINDAYDVTLTKVSAIASAVKSIGIEDIEQAVGSVNRATQNLTATLKEVSDQSGSLFDSITKSSNEATVGLESIGAGAAGGALLGVGLAFKAVTSAVEGFYSVLKSVTSIVAGVVKGLFNITKAILSIPFKVYQGLVKMSNEVAEALTEAQRAMEGVRKEFGAFSGPLSSAVVSVTRRFENFKQTGLSTWQVFGNIAQRIEYVREVSATLGAAMGKMTTEFRENGGAVLGFQKGLGLTSENLRGIADLSLSLGQRMSKTLLGMTKQAVELGKAFKLDSKLIGRDMGKALQDVTHFGGATVRQIAQASVYARRLGLELEKITGTLTAFETFDTAAENSAKLAQSFGVLTDAFSLMAAQSPDEQIDALRNAFFAAGRTTEGMTRQELKLLSQTTGLDEATARLVFSQRNQSIGLDQLRKKAAQAETAEVTQANALKSIAENIERIIRSTPEFTGFFDAFAKGIGRGIVTSGVFMRGVFNLREALLATWRAGAKLGREFVKSFPGIKTLLEGIAELFQPAKFKRFADGIVRVFAGFFHEISEGRYSFSALIANLKSNFFDFLSREAPAGRKILSGFETFMSTMGRIVLEGAKFFIRSAGELMKSLARWIQDPSGAVKAYQSAVSSAGRAGSMGAAIISTIKKEIFNDEVLGTLIDGFERLFDAVMDKIAPKLAKILSRSVYSAFGQGALTKATGIQKKVLDDAIADTDKTLDEINETIGSRIERETLAALGHAEVQSDAEAAIVTKIKDRYRQALDNVKKARENFAGEVTADQALDQLDKAKKFQRAMSDFLLSTPTNVPSGAVKPQPVTQKVVEQVKQQVTALSEVKQRFEDEPQKYSRAIVDVATNVREATQQLKSVSDEAVQAMFSRLQAIDKVAVPLGDDFGRRVDAYASGISALRSFDPRGFVTIAKIAKDGQLEAALSGLKQMVATANELQEALGKGSANQFDLSVPLKNVAAGVGLGAKQSYQIKNKDFVINLNLKVVMEAGAVERVILQRQDSIIRDRLQNASYKGTSSPPDIPTTPSSPSPPPIGPIVK